MTKIITISGIDSILEFYKLEEKECEACVNSINFQMGKMDINLCNKHRTKIYEICLEINEKMVGEDNE